MACRLNLSTSALTALLALGTVSSTQAQALPDPTRPSGSAEYGTEFAYSGLQSIIWPASGKPRALINGELVSLGGKAGEARLVAIKTDSVVLQNSDGTRETLTLTPGISKKPRPPHSKPVPREP